MVRSILSKVAWVGRTASMVFGLVLVLALVLGIASMALGANGDFFKVGKTNFASAVSTLTKSGAGPALSLKVDQGKPLAVNSSTRVDNLNADKLDGKDASALGITTAQNRTKAFNCSVLNASNECGKIQVVVPTGKQYIVDVWSSINWTTDAATVQPGWVEYCSAMNSGSGPQCITPFGERSVIFFDSGDMVSASSEGQTGVLNPGTYTFSTMVVPGTNSASGVGAGGHPVITKVLVRDASNPGPTGVTVQ